METKLVLSIHELETILRNAKKMTKSHPNTFNGKNIATIILTGETKKTLWTGKMSINSDSLTMTTPHLDSKTIAALLCS